MRTTLFLCGLLLLVPSSSSAKLYQWTDTNGVIHVVDEAVEIPPAYRNQVKVHEATRPASSRVSLPLSPSRTYPEHSEGKFAQKLALDLGLIQDSSEDGLGPLSGAGIQPAGGWEVSDSLTSEVVYDVLASVRRAADAQRITLSADGAEAVVKQVATAILPPTPVVREQEPQEPQVIIYEAPQQIIEVEQERYYDPVYIPVPMIQSGRHRHRHRHRDRDRQRDDGTDIIVPRRPTGPHTSGWDQPTPRTRHSPSGQHTVNRTPHSPTQMPFGLSPTPRATAPMPFGTTGRGSQRR